MQLAGNNLWAFWKLDQYIKNQLFFSHKRLTQRGGQPRQQQSGPNNDMRTMLFGSVVPSSIPESSTWWKAHAALLLNMGVFSGNARGELPVTQNNRGSSAIWRRFLTMPSWA